MLSRKSDSEDSDVSDSFVDVKSTFRVSVCLHRYFEDVRARSYILITPNRRVRWLQKRIQKVFRLPGAFCLCTNGHLLPSSEPLGLLRPEDRIDVMPLEDVQVEGINVDNTKNTNISKEKVDGKVMTSLLLSTDCYVSAQNGTISNEEYNIENLTNNDNNNTRNSNFFSKDQVDNVTYQVNGDSPVCNDFSICSQNLNSRDGTETAINCHDEIDALKKLKQHALTLLDTHSGYESKQSDNVDKEPTRRVRRRVRRRSRRGASLATTLDAFSAGSKTQFPDTAAQFAERSQFTLPMDLMGPPESTHAASAEHEAPFEPAAPSGPVAPAEHVAPAEDEAGTSPQGEVARNETTWARKPRMVRSLDIEAD